MQEGDILTAEEASRYEAVIDELVALRVSVGRIAQASHVDNELGVGVITSIGSLRALAMDKDRGWNDLAGRCVEAAGKVEWLQDSRTKGWNLAKDLQTQVGMLRSIVDAIREFGEGSEEVAVLLSELQAHMES